jgi:polysaccharide pyruvyl transferase WcaK-like protein
MTNIIVYGNFTTTNYGNECTLQAALHNLRDYYPDANITAVCTGPELVTRNHHINAIPITAPLFPAWNPTHSLTRRLRQFTIGLASEPIRWVKAFNHLKRNNLFIVPGTGPFNDAHGFLGWGQYQLLKWSVLAKLRGSKILFISVGAGPIYTRRGRILNKTIIGLADFRSYRDITSKDTITNITPRAQNDQVNPDLVFSLPITPFPDHNNRQVVGLGLMTPAGKYSDPNPDRATHEAYLNSFVILSHHLLSHGYDIRLLIGAGEDRNVTKEFKSLLNQSLSPFDQRRIIDESVSTVEDLLHQISSTDYVIATRFHNLLLAIILNKPVISISFHHKCESLMREMGLLNYCIAINKLQPHNLLDKFTELENNAFTLKQIMRQKTVEFNNILNLQYQSIFSK